LIAVWTVTGCSSSDPEIAGVTMAGTDGDDDGDTTDDGGDGGGAPPDRVPRFVEVSAEAGLFGDQHGFAPGECVLEPYWTDSIGNPFVGDNACIAQVVTGGAVVADYDDDGFDDVFLPRLDAPAILFRNEGNGTFADVTAQVGLQATAQANGGAFVDVDNDGDRDLVVVAWNAPAHQLWINEEGTFVEDGEARGVAMTASSGVHLGSSVATGDFDGDGWLDLFTTEWSPDFLEPNGSRLLRNLGAASPGHFEDVTDLAGLTDAGVNENGRWSFTPTFIDLDDDGRLDLAIASDFETSAVYWNEGDGTFTRSKLADGIGSDDFGMGSAFADVDGDGLTDWFVTSVYDPLSSCVPGPECEPFSGNRLYRNRGDRTFEDLAYEYDVYESGWAWGAAFTDVNDDGALDLLVTNGYRDHIVDFSRYETDRNVLWLGTPGQPGQFTDASTSSNFDGSEQGRALIAFDYDRDGDRDVLVSRNGAPPLLYRNDGAVAQGHWLDVRVRIDGRPAIGAVVRVQAATDGDEWYRKLGTRGHLFGQAPVEAHFGLGEHDGLVERVTVELPGEPAVELTDVPVDELLVVDL